jgi:hypothetical protein
MYETIITVLLVVSFFSHWSKNIQISELKQELEDSTEKARKS